MVEDDGGEWAFLDVWSPLGKFRARAWSCRGSGLCDSDHTDWLNQKQQTLHFHAPIIVCYSQLDLRGHRVSSLPPVGEIAGAKQAAEQAWNWIRIA